MCVDQWIYKLEVVMNISYPLLISDYSRFGSVYMMHNKSEFFKKLKEFKVKVEKQLGKPLKKLRFDRGGGYLPDEFKQYLTDNRIISNLSASRTPQHNG